MATDGTTTDAGVIPGTEKAGTPKDTYSKEEVAKLVTEARTSALADVGRLRAEATKALTAATQAQERLNAMEQARIDEELETHRDEPAEIKRIRAEQAKKRSDAELANIREELREKNEKLAQLETEKTESSKQQIAREIAARLNVDPEKLIKFAKLTDGSAEAIGEIAQDMPKVTPRRPGLTSDSNRGSGGSGAKTPTLEELKASSPEETEKKVKSGEWVVRGWRG